MDKGRVVCEFIGLCRAKSLDTRSALGKSIEKKYTASTLSASGFICVNNKFFHSIPGVRVKQIFFVCVSSVASL